MTIHESNREQLFCFVFVFKKKRACEQQTCAGVACNGANSRIRAVKFASQFSTSDASTLNARERANELLACGAAEQFTSEHKSQTEIPTTNAKVWNYLWRRVWPVSLRRRNGEQHAVKQLNEQVRAATALALLSVADVWQTRQRQTSLLVTRRSLNKIERKKQPIKHKKQN